nr:immunoglobulin heavy chain junction region [Macaca mulatta]
CARDLWGDYRLTW